MSAQDTVFSQKTEALFGANALPCVMGILNITPDSFHDGGRHTSEEAWLKHAEKMVQEGASIIDIGAASSRPGSEEISSETELDRLLPALRSVRKNFPEVLISVDTYRSEIAGLARDNGADIINDISGGTLDPAMLRTVARLNIPYIMMHMKGVPKTMQQAPAYNDVTQEVTDFFKLQINRLKELNFNKIILDPGFGFGKDLQHNFRLLADLGMIRELGFPVLAGLSRKSMINKTLNISQSDALNGTTVLNTIALSKGAGILRVHDVKEAVEAIKLISQLPS
jgi:dihydropteroate synthase